MRKNNCSTTAVVERCGHIRVIRAKYILVYCLTPLIEWLSFCVLALECCKQRSRVIFVIKAGSRNADEHFPATPGVVVEKLFLRSKT